MIETLAAGAALFLAAAVVAMRFGDDRGASKLALGAALFITLAMLGRYAETHPARPTIELGAPTDVPAARLDFSRRNEGAR